MNTKVGKRLPLDRSEHISTSTDQHVGPTSPAAATSDYFSIRFDLFSPHNTFTALRGPGLHRAQNVPLQLLCSPSQDVTAGVDVPTCQSVGLRPRQDPPRARKNPTSTPNAFADSKYFRLVRGSRHKYPSVTDDPTDRPAIRPDAPSLHPVPQA